MRNAQYKDDFNTVDETCSCYTCQNFSRAYLRHLFIAEEILALELASIHNLHFYLDLMRKIREAITHNGFDEFRRQFKATMLQKQLTEKEA